MRAKCILAILHIVIATNTIAQVPGWNKLTSVEKLRTANASKMDHGSAISIFLLFNQALNRPVKANIRFSGNLADIKQELSNLQFRIQSINPFSIVAEGTVNGLCKLSSHLDVTWVQANIIPDFTIAMPDNLPLTAIGPVPAEDILKSIAACDEDKFDPSFLEDVDQTLLKPMFVVPFQGLVSTGMSDSQKFQYFGITPIVDNIASIRTTLDRLLELTLESELNYIESASTILSMHAVDTKGVIER